MMTSSNPFAAEHRKQRLLREALVDVRSLASIVGSARPVVTNSVSCRPIARPEESAVQAIGDNNEGMLYQVIGTGIPVAILLVVAAGLMTIGAQGPVSTALARPTTAAIHGVPDASTALDASVAAEPLPPTF